MWHIKKGRKGKEESHIEKGRKGKKRNCTLPDGIWMPPAARSADTVLDPSDAAFER